MEATDLMAASSKSFADTIGRPDSFKIRLASCTFVPSNLTTNGTDNVILLKAFTIPLAIVAQLTIPPKILTNIPFTFGSEKKKKIKF